jgi:hypothetical protein
MGFIIWISPLGLSTFNDAWMLSVKTMVDKTKFSNTENNPS